MERTVLVSQSPNWVVETSIWIAIKQQEQKFPGCRQQALHLSVLTNTDDWQGTENLCLITWLSRCSWVRIGPFTKTTAKWLTDRKNHIIQPPHNALNINIVFWYVCYTVQHITHLHSMHVIIYGYTYIPERTYNSLWLIAKWHSMFPRRLLHN